MVAIKVVCEGLFASNSRPQAAAALTKMWTLIMAASRDNGCQFQEVLPSAWKKAVLGSGKATKEDSKARWCMDDDNIADSRCILEYALLQKQKEAKTDLLGVCRHNYYVKTPLRGSYEASCYV